MADSVTASAIFAWMITPPLLGNLKEYITCTAISFHARIKNKQNKTGCLENPSALVLFGCQLEFVLHLGD